MEIFGKAKKATSDITWRIRFACWKIKTTDKGSEYIILIVFASEQWVKRTPLNATFIRTLPVLLLQL